MYAALARGHAGARRAAVGGPGRELTVAALTAHRRGALAAETERGGNGLSDQAAGGDMQRVSAGYLRGDSSLDAYA